MPSPSGFILRFAWPGAVLLVLAVAGLVLFALLRHASRRSRLRHLKELRGELEPLLRDLYSGAVEYERGLNRLRALTFNLNQRSLEAVLIAERDPPPGRVPVLRRLCEDLGLVSAWHQQLIPGGAASAGKPHGYTARVRAAARPLGFVRRAEAAENLGVIRHRPSWPRLVAALSDPHISVRSVAARSLAAISEPESFCQLAKRLRSAALELVPEISPWILKMALASFPLAEATKLREFLEDPCRPLRSLTAEVVAAMVEHEAAVCAREHRRASCLDPGLIELFLTRLASDHDPEVRARAADIAARVEDTRSLPVLNALANDPEWVVRLHAIRALGRQRLSSLQEISRHLTDRNWRVREAAVQVLSARGPAGIQRLVDHFLTAEDRYSKEQIAEQIGKTGLIRSFVEGFGSPGHESERRFIEGMIRIGKGDAILAAVGNGTRRRRSSILRQALASSPDLAIRAFAEQLAAGHENRGASENWSLDASKLAARSPV